MSLYPHTLHMRAVFYRKAVFYELVVLHTKLVFHENLSLSEDLTDDSAAGTAYPVPRYNLVDHLEERYGEEE